MKTLMLIAILWVIIIALAFVTIGVIILTKREKQNPSPVKFYRIYRKPVITIQKR